MDVDIAPSNTFSRPSRRQVLAGGAALILSGRASVLAQSSSAPSAPAVNAWLRVAADDTVTITLAQSERGQGVATTLPLALADELGAAWPRVKFEWADFDPAFRHPQYQWMFTGNSESISTFFPMMRTIGAAAREMLLQAAAKRLGVAANGLRAENGRIHHDATGRSVSFGDVAADAAAI